MWCTDFDLGCLRLIVSVPNFDFGVMSLILVVVLFLSLVLVFIQQTVFFSGLWGMCSSSSGN